MNCSADGRVTHISLASANLYGPLPAAVFSDLPALVRLDLSGNRLTGALPAALRLSSLTFLNVSYNELQYPSTAAARDAFLGATLRCRTDADVHAYSATVPLYFPRTDRELARSASSLAGFALGGLQPL